MSVPFVKNFAGIRQSDFELLQVPHPKLELGIHVTFKCVQAGTLLGSIISPVFQVVNSGQSTASSLQAAAVNGGIKGAVVGLIAGPLVTALRLRSLDTIGTYDRCYRLRFNTNQLFVDRMALLGCAVGAGLAQQTGFVFGMDIALIGSLLINSIWKR